MPNDGLHRCAWSEGSDLERRYHDLEWGVPIRDDHRLFELLTLEGAQAGLSWRIVLRKRDGYRAAFADFDPVRVARFRPARVESLLLNADIVRHRGKIESVIANAKAIVGLRDAYPSFSTFVWETVGDRPIVNRWSSPKQVPSETSESRALSKRLREHGFRFVGPTTMYAFMQAAGLVNDHLVDCHRWGALADRR